MPECFRNIVKSVLTLLFLNLFPFTSDASVLTSEQEITSYISNNIPIDNQNWNICQSPVTGFVYFANTAGLGEYNGISLKMFHLPYKQSVRSVIVSEKGIVFTGSFEEFGYWKDTTGGELRYVSLSKRFGIEKNDEIWKIYELAGKIFFQSFTTIYCYDYKAIKAIKAPFTLLFIFRCRDKFIAQILGNGLYWFDGDKFEKIEGSSFFEWNKVHAVIRRSDTEYWICTSNNGIYRFDGKKFSYFDSEISSFLTTQTCNAGLTVSDTSFVFGTISNGLVFSDENGKIIKRYNYSNGLKNNTVLSLFRDKNNGLWIGLDEGANYINIFSPEILYANISGTLGTIYSIIRDKSKLYIGTNHGLFKSDISQINEEYSFSNIEIIPQTQGQVWTIEKYDNQILVGHNDGTFLLDNDHFRQISYVTGGWCIRQYNDLLIEGTYTGIVFFRKDETGKWSFRNRIKGFSEPTRHIEVDYLGYIWASHPQKGMYKLELNEALDSVVSVKYFNNILGNQMSFDIYKINNQVVFTNSEDIYKYDYDLKTIIPFSELNKALGYYKSASQIVHSAKSNYWFISENKIALFEISKDFEAMNRLELMQKGSDLPERELQIINLSQRTILIPTRKVFFTYNLSLLQRKAEESRLNIRMLQFQGKKRTYEFMADSPVVIKVPHSSNNLRTYFSDPSHFDQENKEYLYRIVELDSNWYNTNQDNLTYLNIPAGTFKLQVKSDLSNSFSEITFTIERPWYITPQAFVIYFLLLTGLIILTIKVFRIELKKQKQLIEFEIINNKLVSDLDFRSYELMLTMRYLIQKNEILTELNEQINLLKEQSTKFPVKFIREMESIIERGLGLQTEEWKNAMSSLKLSQQGFFKRLIEKHPDLTPNDMRLCSYLRMNFSTKEIAKLLNISGRAVEISRYRLRRKMNLGHDINLTEYLIKEGDSD
jgi:DNA-binding CsgD family transcriptional regulator